MYAPGLKDAGLEASAAGTLPPASLSSSFSNIGHDQAQTPGSETKSPVSVLPGVPGAQLLYNVVLRNNNSLGSAAGQGFNAVYSQALSLVEKETMVMPFTTPNGYVHILRHLQPQVVYLQESLAGEEGALVNQLQTWLRYDVILVVGANDGHGGLADSESEAEQPEKEKEEDQDIWWQREERVGRGRGVVVVDSSRLGDDWERRVQGKE